MRSGLLAILVSRRRFTLRIEFRQEDCTFDEGLYRARTQNALGLSEVLERMAPLAGLTENVPGTSLPRVHARPPPRRRPSARAHFPPARPCPLVAHRHRRVSTQTTLGAAGRQVQTADIAEYLDALQHALTTMKELTLGDGTTWLPAWQRMAWRDLIAMFMFSPNPRSGSGLPTRPKRVPIVDPRGVGMSVEIGYDQLWFRQPARDWQLAHTVYNDPLGQVEFGGAAEPAESEDDADGGLDDAAELGRQRIEAKAAAALERARRRAAEQAAQVRPRFSRRSILGDATSAVRPRVTAQFMQATLRDVLPDFLRLWIELNVLLSLVTVRGVAMYHYYITPAGLSAHGMSTKNAAGVPNTRGLLSTHASVQRSHSFRVL